MEYNSFGPNPFEAPDSGSDPADKDPKKAKKKARFLELPIDDNKPSLEVAKKPERAEPPLEKLTPDETQQVSEQIAGEHLTSIDKAEAAVRAELEPAHDFLERVTNGETVDDAFYETAEQAGIASAEADAALLQLSEAEDEPEPELSNTAEQLDGVIDPGNEDEGEIAWRTPPAGGAGGNGGGRPPAGPAAAGAPMPGPRPRRVVAAANAMPPAAHNYYERRNQSHDFVAGALVGGVVGYLMGRRKGRIKTEKRLIPVQKKLEKQVVTLERAIAQKEQALVLAKSQQRSVEARPKSYPTTERTQPGRRETRLGMEKPTRAEHLGHMIIAAEAPTKNVERVHSERPNNIREAFRAEEVKTMQRNELLELSEKIVIEGASLRRIYESRLIGEKQLRHLVSEYLQGKDIRRDLRREMVEHEIDFERDPILRDRVRSHLSSNANGGGLGELLASVGIVDKPTDPTLARRIAADEQRQAAAKRKHDRQRAIADTAMATAIVVLAIVVAVLVARG